MKAEPFVVGPGHIPSLNELIDGCKVPAVAVEGAKKALCQSMNGFLNTRSWAARKERYQEDPDGAA